MITAVILLSPTTSMWIKGVWRTELAFLTSLLSVLLSAASAPAHHSIVDGVCLYRVIKGSSRVQGVLLRTFYNAAVLMVFIRQGLKKNTSITANGTVTFQIWQAHWRPPSLDYKAKTVSLKRIALYYVLAAHSLVYHPYQILCFCITRILFHIENISTQTHFNLSLMCMFLYRSNEVHYHSLLNLAQLCLSNSFYHAQNSEHTHMCMVISVRTFIDTMHSLTPNPTQQSA